MGIWRPPVRWMNGEYDNTIAAIKRQEAPAILYSEDNFW